MGPQQKFGCIVVPVLVLISVCDCWCRQWVAGLPGPAARCRGDAGLVERFRGSQRHPDTVVSQLHRGVAASGHKWLSAASTPARRWLIEGPAHLRSEQIDNAGNAAIELRSNRTKLTSGALSTAATITSFGLPRRCWYCSRSFSSLRGPEHQRYVTGLPGRVRDRVRAAGPCAVIVADGYARATF